MHQIVAPNKFIVQIYYNQSLCNTSFTVYFQLEFKLNINMFYNEMSVMSLCSDHHKLLE